MRLKIHVRVSNPAVKDLWLNTLLDIESCDIVN